MTQNVVPAQLRFKILFSFDVAQQARETVPWSWREMEFEVVTTKGGMDVQNPLKITTLNQNQPSAPVYTRKLVRKRDKIKAIFQFTTKSPPRTNFCPPQTSTATM